MNTVAIFLVVILLIIISMVDIKYKLIYDWHLLLLFIVILVSLNESTVTFAFYNIFFKQI